MYVEVGRNRAFAEGGWPELTGALDKLPITLRQEDQNLGQRPEALAVASLTYVRITDTHVMAAGPSTYRATILNISRMKSSGLKKQRLEEELGDAGPMSVGGDGVKKFVLQTHTNPGSLICISGSASVLFALKPEEDER